MNTGWNNFLLTLPYSEAQEMLIWLETVGDNRHIEVMLTGRLGRLGSMPGLLVGMGFCWLKEQTSLGFTSLQVFFWGGKILQTV